MYKRQYAMYNNVQAMCNVQKCTTGDVCPVLFTCRVLRIYKVKHESIGWKLCNQRSKLKTAFFQLTLYWRLMCAFHQLARLWSLQESNYVLKRHVTTENLLTSKKIFRRSSWLELKVPLSTASQLFRSVVSLRWLWVLCWFLSAVRQFSLLQEQNKQKHRFIKKSKRLLSRRLTSSAAMLSHHQPIWQSW